jgi:hypothetical protein
MAAKAEIAVAERILTLFRDPTLEGMLALEWPEFEDFEGIA